MRGRLDDTFPVGAAASAARRYADRGIDSIRRFLADVGDAEQFRLRAPSADGEIERAIGADGNSVKGKGVRDRNSSLVAL